MTTWTLILVPLSAELTVLTSPSCDLLQVLDRLLLVVVAQQWFLAEPPTMQCVCSFVLHTILFSSHCQISGLVTLQYYIWSCCAATVRWGCFYSLVTVMCMSGHDVQRSWVSWMSSAGTLQRFLGPLTVTITATRKSSGLLCAQNEQTWGSRCGVTMVRGSSSISNSNPSDTALASLAAEQLILYQSDPTMSSKPHTTRK